VLDLKNQVLFIRLNGFTLGGPFIFILQLQYTFDVKIT